MPSVDDDLKVPEKVWLGGTSNDIIILGERVKLVLGDGPQLVRNYVDHPDIDFKKVAVARGKRVPVRDRKGKPSTMEALKESISYVVVHTDLTPHAMETFRVLLGRDPTPLSTHFCINWNGVIYQYADVAERTAHAAGHNEQSIGLDMNSRLVNYDGRFVEKSTRKEFDRLRKAYKNLAKEKLREPPFNLSGKKLAEVAALYEFERPVRGRIQGGNTQRVWGYTPMQYKSLILLLKLFVRELDLEKSYPSGVDGTVIPGILEDDDTKKLKGFVGHYHLDTNRWDPGPNFDWQRVLSGIQSEYNWFPLAWKEELVLQGRDIGAAAAAAHELVRNTEQPGLGGTFPIGPNQTWHGGVHLFPPQESKVKRKRYGVHAMLDGVVVAAHFEPGRRELGHNNFVVLRHDMVMPDPKGKPGEDGSPPTTTLRFFSLYMHLDSMDVSKVGGEKLAEDYEKLQWVKRLYDLEAIQEQAGSDDVKKAVETFEKRLQAQRENMQQQLDSGELVDMDLAELILDIDEDVDDSLDDQAAPFLKVGTAGAALQDSSQIAVLIDETVQVKVSAGEVLGFTGLLPTTGSEEERLQSGVHVEVFCGEETFQKLDLDTHAEHFRTPQRSRWSDLTVRTEDILMIFRDASRYKPYRGLQFWPDERISPEEITGFYSRKARGERDRTELYREQLRRSITYHVSEWSDQVDWIASLTEAQDWNKALTNSKFKEAVQGDGIWRKEIQKFLPFVWLNEEVATLIGLLDDGEKWDGRFYHFHPIHFVMWSTFYAVKRTRVYRTSVSLAALVRRRKRKKAIESLVGKGKAAKLADTTNDNGKAWKKYEARTLPRGLRKAPFYLTKKKLKKAKYKEQRDELVTKILNLIAGEVEDEGDDELHGVVEVVPPAYSNPGEVLDALYQIPRELEWKVPDLDQIN